MRGSQGWKGRKDERKEKNNELDVEEIDPVSRGLIDSSVASLVVSRRGSKPGLSKQTQKDVSVDIELRSRRGRRNATNSQRSVRDDVLRRRELST